MNSSMDNASVNVHECEKCLKLETELLNKEDFVEKEIYDKLFKSFTTLEKHCISLEVDTQLNQEIFQRDNSVSNQSAPSFDQLFELNELKAQSQEKDTVIKKLKERIKHKHTQEEATVLRDLVEHVKANYPLDHPLESACSCFKHMTGDRSQLTNFVNKFLGTVKFGNDHVAKILGYGDYQIGNITISMVYYVEGLGHNVFFVGKFYMMVSSPICLLSKASKTKSWLWHRRLSHLNFGAINHLARHGLVRGLPKLKFEKDHLCSACAMGKSKKKPHKPKSEDTNQEKLYLLHMDLCGLLSIYMG
ncbi:retrovirus-related pol polyprotein from transposon TNT 1-94 [Tanacetum coccineum]